MEQPSNQHIKIKNNSTMNYELQQQVSEYQKQVQSLNEQLSMLQQNQINQSFVNPNQTMNQTSFMGFSGAPGYFQYQQQMAQPYNQMMG